MNNDYQILKDDLTRIGIKRGDSVLLHSSYKSMGSIDGGIATLIDAMLSVIGDSGTLIVPTLTYSYVTVDDPTFDYVNTPSCVGAVSEFVRRMEGSKRSIHPTHSCSAIGAMRDYYADGHEKDCTPVGVNSPFFKLKENGGKVLMLGCGTAHNTSMHGVEECYGTSYVLNPLQIECTMILPDRTFTAGHHRHNITQNGYAQRYDRLSNVIDPKYMPKSLIHGAESHLIDAAEMWRVGLETLKHDEFYFVEKL